MVAGNTPHRAHVRFRDLLRERPDVALAYAELKRDLARRYGDDRLGYTDAKAAFITRALGEGG